MQNLPLNRRSFLKASCAVSAAALLPAVSARKVYGANARLNVAFIGTGGIAPGQAIGSIAPFGVECPCFADVDTKQWGNVKGRWNGAEGFQDYRKMFDKNMKAIDAVMVSTPDHHHYPATILAMMGGKHVYTQKPLTHTVWEANQLTLAMDKYKVATQMGNQYHAGEGNRRIVEWIRSGALGKVKELHVWTDRPDRFWKQGLPRPEGADPVPQNLDWDTWLGPAPQRPYKQADRGIWHSIYHQGSWRGFRDFGGGALGDMGCHTMDGPFWSLEVETFKTAELIKGGPVRGKDMWPDKSKVKLELQTKRNGMVDLYWYENGLLPDKPANMPGNFAASGALFICEKGILVTYDDYGQVGTVVMNDAKPGALVRQDPNSSGANYKIIGDVESPARSLERSEGHHKEWYLACTGEKPYNHPRANFSYAGPFTQTLLAASIAQVVGGKVAYDAKAMKFDNDEATALLTKNYRKGWEFKM